MYQGHLIWFRLIAYTLDRGIKSNPPKHLDPSNYGKSDFPYLGNLQYLTEFQRYSLPTFCLQLDLSLRHEKGTMWEKTSISWSCQKEAFNAWLMYPRTSNFVSFWFQMIDWLSWISRDPVATEALGVGKVTGFTDNFWRKCGLNVRFFWMASGLGQVNTSHPCLRCLHSLRANLSWWICWICMGSIEVFLGHLGN